jgi:hypothetical protein
MLGQRLYPWIKTKMQKDETINHKEQTLILLVFSNTISKKL